MNGVAIVDLTDNGLMTDWYQDNYNPDALTAKMFEVGGVWVELGIREEAGLKLGYMEVQTCHLNDITPEVLGAIQKIGEVVSSFEDLFETLRMFKTVEVYKQYVKGEHAACDIGHKFDWKNIHVVENQNYFPIPRPIQKFIDDMRANRPNGYVYILQSDSGYWKIGRAKNPDDRMKTFSVKLPFMVNYEIVIPSTDYVALEKELHERFAYCRVNGEWFDLTDGDILDLKREFHNVAEKFNE